jgi:hypothetical protein
VKTELLENKTLISESEDLMICKYELLGNQYLLGSQ